MLGRHGLTGALPASESTFERKTNLLTVCMRVCVCSFACACVFVYACACVRACVLVHLCMCVGHYDCGHMIVRRFADCVL